MMNETQGLSRLRAELDDYEQRYGLRSEELEAALTSGRLEETFEVCCWANAYAMWRELTCE